LGTEPIYYKGEIELLDKNTNSPLEEELKWELEYYQLNSEGFNKIIDITE
jgi:hypothetical protein